MTEHDQSKRKFVKQLTYLTPAILTLPAAMSFASAGSGRHGKGNDGVGNGLDPQPPSPPWTPPHRWPNDGSGTSPGNPGRIGGHLSRSSRHGRPRRSS